MRKISILILGLMVIGLGAADLTAWPRQEQPAPSEEGQILSALHSISSHTLYDYVRELVSEKYGGRLTGTPEYDACADWVASLLKKWGVRPAGDGGSFLQAFPNPYTLVFPGCEVYLRLPVKGAEIRKYYRYEDEFIPGGTSGNGEVTAEVVYAGGCKE